jgi:hypothetical protein
MAKTSPATKPPPGRLWPRRIEEGADHHRHRQEEPGATTGIIGWRSPDSSRRGRVARRRATAGLESSVSDRAKITSAAMERTMISPKVS